jgi:translation elongation factor EF-Tu-like GTPase
LETDTERADGQGGASGILEDVFALTGRGTVAVIDQLQGVLRIGDLAILPQGPVSITGVEMIRYRDAPKVKPTSIGVLLGGVEKAELEPLKGARIAFKAGPG